MIKKRIIKVFEFLTNTIRKKLIISFIIIIVPFLLLSSYTFFSGRVLINNYNSTLEKHILLNNIFINVRTTQDYLKSYLSSGSQDILQKYIAANHDLSESADMLKTLADNKNMNRATTDLKYMINTYINEANSAINLMRNEKRAESYNHYDEAKKVSDLIEGAYKEISSSLSQSTQEFIEKTIDNKNRQYAMNGLLIILSGTLSIIFIQMISLTITNPLKKLTYVASQYPDGNNRINELKSSNDEVGILTETFKKMLKKIRQQMIEINEKAKLEKKLRDEEIENLQMKSTLKDMELKALQLKINPHFIFNSLNLISQMAYLEDAEKTSSLLESMNDLIRYNLDKFDRIVSMEDEYSNVQDYIYIQEERFGDRIQFDIDVDKDLNKYPIPCLILQPLIENSIIHGVQSYVEGGYVGLRVKRQKNRIVIRVFDNGKGIKRRKLIELNRHLQNNDQNRLGGIGLSNVVARLNIFYENKVRIKIRSIEGKGTIVRIEIPIIEKE